MPVCNFAYVPFKMVTVLILRALSRALFMLCIWHRKGGYNTATDPTLQFMHCLYIGPY